VDAAHLKNRTEPQKPEAPCPPGPVARLLETGKQATLTDELTDELAEDVTQQGRVGPAPDMHRATDIESPMHQEKRTQLTLSPCFHS
jgi:hypothetical protein